METGVPLLLDDPKGYTGEFSDFGVTVEAIPTRDILLSYAFKVKTFSDNVLLPIPGFKSDFMTIGPFPFPLSVKIKPVTVIVEKVTLRNTKGVSVDVDAGIHRLRNGYRGVLIPLSKDLGAELQVCVQCSLMDFSRIDPLNTELVIGIFPPWGWEKGDISVSLRGALQSGSTWGQKLIAGVHNMGTGRRRKFWEKYKPPHRFKRLLKTGNNISWEFLAENVEQGEEIRLRARASRVPLLGIIPPLIVWAVAAILVFGRLVEWFVRLIINLIKLLWL